MIEVVTGVSSRFDGLERLAGLLQGLTGEAFSEAVPKLGSEEIIDGPTLYAFIGAMRVQAGDEAEFLFVDDEESISLSGRFDFIDGKVWIGLSYPRSGRFGDMLFIRGTLKSVLHLASLIDDEPEWRSTDSAGGISLGRLLPLADAARGSEDRGFI